MMLEPAPQSAGEAAPAAHGPDPATEPGPATTRLPAPARQARRRAEHEHWLWRRGLERQLHDGAALRISALALQLGLFRHSATPSTLGSAPGLGDSVERMQDELHAVLQELRDVAARLYPPLLDEAGLGPALRELADRAQVPARVIAPADRFGPAVEGAAYFAVAEAIPLGPDTETESAHLDVLIRREDNVLVVAVVGADMSHADAMQARVRPLDGTIDISPRTGTIIVRIPCA